MSLLLLCECAACGQRAVWPTPEDAAEWAASHWQPEALGWIHVGGAMERFRGVFMS